MPSFRASSLSPPTLRTGTQARKEVIWYTKKSHTQAKRISQEARMMSNYKIQEEEQEK